MDKNRIEGRQGASRWHNTPKASGMPLEVNAAAVRRSSVPLPGEIPPPEGGGKSAEAIVAGGTSRGLEDARPNNETGGLNPTKGRTNEEGIDPATDKPADDAGRRGELESRGGGKHGAPRERNMIEEILEPGNLAEAWKRVKANKGAPGIDGMTVGDFPALARGHWPRIAGAIRKGDYRPAPVKRVWIIPPSAGSAKSLRGGRTGAPRRAVRSPTGANARWGLTRAALSRPSPLRGTSLRSCPKALRPSGFFRRCWIG